MTITTTRGAGAHAGQRIHAVGAPLETARAAMVMIHGRGASARDILMLAESFGAPDIAYLAPQASGSVWYPYRFLEPTGRNQPHLDSALETVGLLVDDIVAAGTPFERIVLLGFSQGACLASEFAARHPRRYGGMVGLSGGLIGTDDEVVRHHGDLAGTPVILGCSDVDAHIPEARVQETARQFTRLGASVACTIYPGMPHTVVQDEVDQVARLLATI